MGAPAFRPSVAGEEVWPTLPERRTEMRHCFRIFGTRLGMLLQFRQKLFDLPLDLSAGGAGLIVLLRRVQSSVQFDPPIPLTFEPAILGHERAAALDDGQELIQNRMPPFYDCVGGRLPNELGLRRPAARPVQKVACCLR